MELEMIAKVNADYGSSEPVKPPVAAQAASVLAEPTSGTTGVKTGESGTGREQGSEPYKKRVPSEATINDAVTKANHRMEHTRCEYSYHKDTKRVSIKVIDADTEEVVKEIPPEKSLDMLQKMWELAGILVDEKR